ncbi:MAG: PAS domain-containing protein [Myxococcales bacterium]|nr:PAS domain-containing protein [Myxococcales bacterium]
MTPRALLSLLPVPLVVVAGAVWLAGGDLALSATAGLVAALICAMTVAVVARRLAARMDALTDAARLAQVELALRPETEANDPAKLAGGVAAIAERSRAQARRLLTLSAVLDGMAEGVWITDAAGTVIEHNDALKELLFSGQELSGRRPGQLVQSEELEQAVEKACGRGESSSLEVAILGLRPRVLAVRVAPLGRELGGSSAVFHDITELRRLEAVRKDFVANVSHELRTPITAIRGYAETLKGGALHDEENAGRMVEIIHRQSERLSNLVEDLLELSRLESRELKLESEPVSLALAVGRAAEAIRPRANSKGIALELAVPEGLWACGDERGVEQVLQNLLDNAVKYTGQGGRVEVTGVKQEGRCAVAVRDTGIGVEARHLPRLFERFYRVDRGRSRELGGTGLGLSIVKHLVTAMGGDVRVESRPGEGSEFTVLLPPA